MPFGRSRAKAAYNFGIGRHGVTSENNPNSAGVVRTDGEIGPLTLRFGAEMSSSPGDVVSMDQRLPEPSGNLDWRRIEISAQKYLPDRARPWGLARHPADRRRRHSEFTRSPFRSRSQECIVHRHTNGGIGSFVQRVVLFSTSLEGLGGGRPFLANRPRCPGQR